MLIVTSLGVLSFSLVSTLVCFPLDLNLELRSCSFRLRYSWKDKGVRDSLVDIGVVEIDDPVVVVGDVDDFEVLYYWHWIRH